MWIRWVPREPHITFSGDTSCKKYLANFIFCVFVHYKPIHYFENWLAAVSLVTGNCFECHNILLSQQGPILRILIKNLLLSLWTMIIYNFWRWIWTYILTLFTPMSYFCTPRKRQKTKGFLIFSESIEIGHWRENG